MDARGLHVGHVRGRQRDEPNRVYLHRGIAARQFQRAFVLAEGVEITGAELDNGLLAIDLVRPLVENAVRRVAIKSGGSKPASLSPIGRERS